MIAIIYYCWGSTWKLWGCSGLHLARSYANILENSSLDFLFPAFQVVLGLLSIPDVLTAVESTMSQFPTWDEPLVN